MVEGDNYYDRMFDLTIPNEGRTMDDFDPDHSFLQKTAKSELDISKDNSLEETYRSLYDNLCRLTDVASDASRINDNIFLSRTLFVDEEEVDVIDVARSRDTVYVYPRNQNHYLELTAQYGGVKNSGIFNSLDMSREEFCEFYKDKIDHFINPYRSNGKSH